MSDLQSQVAIRVATITKEASAVASAKMKPSDLTRTREKLGLTKTELARELRVKWATVHQWELPEDNKQNRAIPGMVEAFLERLLREKRK